MMAAKLPHLWNRKSLWWSVLQLQERPSRFHWRSEKGHRLVGEAYLIFLQRLNQCLHKLFLQILVKRSRKQERQINGLICTRYVTGNCTLCEENYICIIFIGILIQYVIFFSFYILYYRLRLMCYNAAFLWLVIDSSKF